MIIPMKRFQWVRMDKWETRLVGVMWKNHPTRVLYIGLWFGKFRWEFDQ